MWPNSVHSHSAFSIHRSVFGVLQDTLPFMICDHKLNSSSCVARRPFCHVVMICHQKSNLPSSVARSSSLHTVNARFYRGSVWRNGIGVRKYTITEVIDRAPNPFQALMNNITPWDVMCLMSKWRSALVKVAKNTQNSNDCSLMKRKTMPNKSFNRKRHREPSRNPVQRILKLLRKKYTEKLFKINWDEVFQSPHLSQSCVAISRIWTPGITVTIFIANLFFFSCSNQNKYPDTSIAFTNQATLHEA